MAVPMKCGASGCTCNICAHCLVGIAQKRTELRSAAFDHSDPHGDEDRADVLSVLELMDITRKRIQQNFWRQDRVTFHLLAAQMQVLHFYL